MEKDTQETLGKFMSVLSTHQATDYTGLLEEKIAELKEADSEQERLRDEIMGYQARIQELTQAQQLAMAEKGKIIDEKIRAGKAATQADTIIKNLQSQMRDLETKHVETMQVKESMMKRLEEESLHSKGLAEEAQARVESSTLETAELQSAMASLHAEIAAQQRELEECKERDSRHIRQKKEVNIRLDEKETELVRAKQERRNAECRITDLEKRLAEVELGNSQIKEEGRTEMDKLTRERENISGSLAKMSLKLKQQTETNKDLNSLVQRMRLELSQAQENASQEGTRADALQRDLEAVQIIVRSLETGKVEAAALLKRTEKDKEELAKELASVSDRHLALQSEQRKMVASLEKLERTRTELTVELSCRAKEFESTKKTADSSSLELEDTRAKLDHERIAKERALERLGVMEADLERAKADLREQVENCESQARQLRESERMREQAMETSRVQQRENANRIIEFSQKNAKLSSEQSAKNDEIFTLKRARDESQAAQQEAQKERDDLKSQYTATRVRLQTVEDQHEEAVARFESSKAEVEELRQELKSEVISRERALAALNEKHEEAINAMANRLENEAEDKSAIAEAARKGAEEKLSRTLSKEKEKHQQELEELQQTRQHDAEVHKARLSTLAKAMEDLQIELREETNKNSSLMQELNVLKDLAEVGSTEAQERVQYVERDRARERARLEGQLQDLKEQLRQQTEQKQQRDQLMATIEQQLSRERESKFNALQKLRSAEDEVSSMTQRVEMLQEEVNSSRKDIRGSERKLAVALQAKDAELARLTRRNQVLGEAVTRLTNGTDGSSSTHPVAKYFEETKDAVTPRETAMPEERQHHKNDEGEGSDDDEDSPVDPVMPRSHGMITRSRLNSAPIQRAAEDESSSQSRIGTAPADMSAAMQAQTSSEPAEPRMNSLMTSQDTEGMESLFSSAQSSPVDADKLEAASVAAAAETDVVTPRSPTSRSDPDSRVNSAESNKSDTSASSFSEKLRLEVDLGKGQELPFSPKKSKRVAMPPAALENADKVKDKENVSANRGSAGVRVKPQDRLSRAKKFMEERKKAAIKA